MEDEDFTVLSQNGGECFGSPEERVRSGPQPGLHSVNSEYLNSQTPHKISAGQGVRDRESTQKPPVCRQSGLAQYGAKAEPCTFFVCAQVLSVSQGRSRGKNAAVERNAGLISAAYLSIYEGPSGAASWLPRRVITEHGGSQSHQRSMTKAAEGESAKSEGEVEGAFSQQRQRRTLSEAHAYNQTVISPWTHTHSSGVASRCRPYELEVIREKYARLPVISGPERLASGGFPMTAAWGVTMMDGQVNKKCVRVSVCIKGSTADSAAVQCHTGSPSGMFLIPGMGCGASLAEPPLPVPCQPALCTTHLRCTLGEQQLPANHFRL
ncbi:hypothetical protein D9C73_015302 [Collichthys lucidus]|uniref:Uncharacterized protein n=1 Tax=Collichthys lucidus TaxID=240159 RepID=A0A4U5V0K1_COLLU|nr:hypothetical protein D9C73_015302 [Collichthys lucidus]